MSKIHLQKIISDLINLVDQKKAENIRLYDVAEHNWMTEHVLVVGVKNKIHLKAVLEDIEQFLDSMEPLEDLFATPRVSGDPNSGWVHCSYKKDDTNRHSMLTALRVNGKTQYKKGLLK